MSTIEYLMEFYSEEQTIEYAKEFAESLRQLDLSSSCVVILLTGELGAGKSVFVRGLAKALGINQPVNSPSYLYVKEYDLNSHNGFRRLIHVDLWRVEQSKDFEALDVGSYFLSGNVVAVEWPKNFINEAYLENQRKSGFEYLYIFKIEIEVGENSRILSIDASTL